jgi:uncharacterized phiE125 gp8 family phage protein
LAEPVSLSEAKAQCRMENDTSDDTFITSLIAPARAYVERVSTYGLVAGTRVFTFAKWGDFLEIYLRPITSVTSVAYTDDAGDAQTYTGYLAPLGVYPFRIHHSVDDVFPTIADGTSIVVTLAAGALDSASQEYLIAKRAMLILIGHWFEYREAAQAGIVSAEIAFCVSSLLDELRPVTAY